MLASSAPSYYTHMALQRWANIIIRVSSIFLRVQTKLSLQSYDHQNFFSRKMDKLLMMCAKGPHVSILMTNDFVVSFGKRISVFCNRFVLLYTFSPKVT